jgi:uncharacterized protein involved in exopolysaccharide biosynthesis
MEGGASGPGHSQNQEAVDKAVPQRVVYVMPQDSVMIPAEDQIDLVQLWQTVWRGKWMIIAITAVFALAAIAYALLATEWYRADVLLAPAEEKSTQGLAAQLGGLASLAGISVGGGSTVEPIAVLKSREFAREFIEELGLLTVLLADDWDAEAQSWKDSNPAKWPDIRDAVKVFDENVRSVREDARTGLVTLSVQWKDPELAAEWANLLVKRLNDRMRKRALREAEANVNYLQRELGATNLVTLQQSIGRLLESELQKLMLARGSEEFSFRVIDRADPPKRRSSPKRTLIVVLATILGGIFATLVVIFRSVALSRTDGTRTNAPSP